MSREKRLKESNYTHVIHPFPALYDADSKILILGSLPSVKSREQNFFYGHPQNRFWKMLAAVLGEKIPETIEEKKELLHRNHIALWDTIYSCDIIGSSDSSIKNVIPSDINLILSYADIKAVFCNGATSHKLYMKYCYPSTKRAAVKLPSTSPANAAWSEDRLTAAWKEEIYKYIMTKA